MQNGHLNKSIKGKMAQYEISINEKNNEKLMKKKRMPPRNNRKTQFEAFRKQIAKMMAY